MSPQENADNTDGDVQTDTIDLVFKVFAPKLNRVTHRLYLLGSLKQMGAWDVVESAQAFPTADHLHTWQADIQGIPINSTFEWTWVTTLPNKTDVHWEKVAKRNRTVDCFGGVIHTIFGDRDEVFIQSATFAEVSTYRKVQEGQTLVLTGNSSTTGGWNIKKAVKACEHPRNSGYWTAHLAFDSNSGLEFKWAIVRARDGKLHLTEKEKHILFGRQAMLRVVAPWNVARVFVEDTPICQDSPDLVKGQTAILVHTKKARWEAIRNWLKSDPKLDTPILIGVNQTPTPRPSTNSKNVPSKTDQEKAKQALKAMMSAYSLQNISVIGSNTMENVDEHARKRTDSTIKSDRFNKQQTLESGTTDGVSTIKGKGQTVVPKSSLTDMMNEQPMVNATLLGLVHVTESTESSEFPSKTHNDETREDTIDIFQSCLPSTGKPDSTPEVDLMLEEMEALKEKFEEIKHISLEDKGILETTRMSQSDFIPSSSCPPPTWSMLQEEEMLKSINGKVNGYLKQKPSKSREKTVTDTDGVLSSRLKTTQDSFKPRPAYTENDNGKPFVMTKGSGKELSWIGMDDTMKSPSEVLLEYANRKMWLKKSSASYGLQERNQDQK